MSLNFPNIDPVIFRISDQLAISWYSLSYIIGILFGWGYLKYLNKRFSAGFTEKFIDDLITYAVIGIVIGGRLGYIIFYDPFTYMAHPIEILKTWKGGMSFHGGTIGFIISFYLTCKLNKQPYLKLMDLTTCVAPIGIFFGRIANFINGELYGRVTEANIGMIFPNGGNLPRHPSQLYEAALEGLLLFTIQFILISCTKIRFHYGILSASFLLQYSLYRFIVEFWREPDPQIGFLGLFTMGQILSLPMIILAAILIFLNWKNTKTHGNNY